MNTTSSVTLLHKLVTLQNLYSSFLSNNAQATKEGKPLPEQLSINLFKLIYLVNSNSLINKQFDILNISQSFHVINNAAQQNKSPYIPALSITDIIKIIIEVLGKDSIIIPQQSSSNKDKQLLRLSPQITLDFIKQNLGEIYVAYKKETLQQIEAFENEYINTLKEVEMIEKGKFDEKVLRQEHLENIKMQELLKVLLRTLLKPSPKEPPKVSVEKTAIPLLQPKQLIPNVPSVLQTPVVRKQIALPATPQTAPLAMRALRQTFTPSNEISTPSVSKLLVPATLIRDSSKAGEIHRLTTRSLDRKVEVMETPMPKQKDLLISTGKAPNVDDAEKQKILEKIEDSLMSSDIETEQEQKSIVDNLRKSHDKTTPIKKSLVSTENVIPKADTKPDESSSTEINKTKELEEQNKHTEGDNTEQSGEILKVADKMELTAKKEAEDDGAEEESGDEKDEEVEEKDLKSEEKEATEKKDHDEQKEQKVEKEVIEKKVLDKEGKEEIVEKDVTVEKEKKEKKEEKEEKEEKEKKESKEDEENIEEKGKVISKILNEKPHTEEEEEEGNEQEGPQNDDMDVEKEEDVDGAEKGKTSEALVKEKESVDLELKVSEELKIEEPPSTPELQDDSKEEICAPTPEPVTPPKSATKIKTEDLEESKELVGDEQEDIKDVDDKPKTRLSTKKLLKIQGEQQARKRKRSETPTNEPLAKQPHHPNKKFQTIALQLITQISAHRFASTFLQPVSVHDEPEYYKLIKDPQDLKTITREVKSGKITNFPQLERNLMLMFCNALMYNETDSDVSFLTLEMMHECEELIKTFRDYL